MDKSLKPEMIRELHRQADLELGKRGVLGSIVYFGALLAFVLATSFERDYPRLTLVYGLLTAVVGLLRIYLTLARNRIYSAHPLLWKRSLVTVIIASAALQGFFSAGTFYGYGVSVISLFAILITVGICGGALTSLKSHPVILRVHLSLMILPSLVVTMLIGGGTAYGLAFLGIQTWFFLIVQGNTQTKVYWDGITDKLLLEERQKEVEAARLAAESANRAKSEFLAGLSHEIRTPMNAILGMTDVLWNYPLDETSKNYVGIIRRAGKVLLNLINDILDLSKIEAGRLGLEKINFDFGELVRKTAEMMTPAANEKNLTLICSVGEGIPEIKGDPYRLRQILTNLISNAIKFTEKGGVYARVEKVSASGTEVVLRCEIADTGIGIQNDKLQVIFESFTQADFSTTRKYGGTGLGLTIAQRLAQMMGGGIEVRSAVGEGSVFTLTIKADMAEGSPSGHAAAEKDVLGKIMQMRPARILLVEDNPENQQVIRAYLESTPLQLDVAGNGAEGVEKFKCQAYDLVLMDIRMPVMDGYQATREIRQWETQQARKGEKPVPILALTASVFENESQKIMECGCTAHILKPILRYQLMETILRYVE